MSNLGGILTDLINVARKVDNYEIYSASGTLWTDTTHFIATVPAGKRWHFMGGAFNRAVSSTCIVTLRNSSDDLLQFFGELSAATGIANYPSMLSSQLVPQVGRFVVMDEGDYIQLLFGTAQDTSSYASCQVLEVDIA